jgi:hypothetical protein
MKRLIAGAVLVLFSAACRIWQLQIPSIFEWAPYLIGAILIFNHFAAGPRKRMWIGAPVIMVLLLIPRVISRWVFR